MKLSRFAGIVTLAFAIGCAAPKEESSDEGVVSTESAIKNGASDFAHPHVGALLWQPPGGGWGQSCSGTLIAPNVVLSAAHCFASGERVPVSFDQNLRTAARSGTLTVVWGTGVPHPDYDPNGDGASDRKDIRVVV